MNSTESGLGTCLPRQSETCQCRIFLFCADCIKHNIVDATPCVLNSQISGLAKVGQEGQESALQRREIQLSREQSGATL